MAGAEASLNRRWAALAPLIADPAAAAVLCDLDGTLAPIVARPELVEVPDRARRALGRIAARYALCAVITGRRPEVARELVGLDGIAYAGNHGFELLEPGTPEPLPSPALAGREGDAPDFAARLDLQALEQEGLRFEDKGPIIAFHWRGAESEEGAKALAAAIATDARTAGLVTHEGRKVLELRPAVRIDKGVAIASLLERTPVRAALYAGDDRTDLDGFSALGALEEAGKLDAIVRVGVLSPEGPPEIGELADLTVDGSEELADLLEALAG
jgi:trehalose 6-phosphate phosphatase